MSGNVPSLYFSFHDDTATSSKSISSLLCRFIQRCVCCVCQEWVDILCVSPSSQSVAPFSEAGVNSMEEE